MIKIQSITDGIVLARDDSKNWYTVNKEGMQVGQSIDRSFCTPLTEVDSSFHEGIKELDEATYGPRF